MFTKEEAMKFVHIADMHFDSPFTSLGRIEGLSDIRRLEQRKIFKKIIEYIQENNQKKKNKNKWRYTMDKIIIKGAKENNLNYAVDIYPFYSSDGSAALRGGNDIKCALIGAGIHASHGMERTHKHGLENTYKLIKLYVNSL